MHINEIYKCTHLVCIEIVMPGKGPCSGLSMQKSEFLSCPSCTDLCGSARGFNFAGSSAEQCVNQSGWFMFLFSISMPHTTPTFIVLFETRTIHHFSGPCKLSGLGWVVLLLYMVLGGATHAAAFKWAYSIPNGVTHMLGSCVWQLNPPPCALTSFRAIVSLYSPSSWRTHTSSCGS